MTPVAAELPVTLAVPNHALFFKSTVDVGTGSLSDT